MAPATAALPAAGPPPLLRRHRALGRAVLGRLACRCSMEERSSSPADSTNRLPDIDWRRYNLQVLFIDRTDTLRGRLAAGMFEKVAEWNGFGRSLLSWTCGTNIDRSVGALASSLGTRASLISQAANLGLPPSLFARPAEAFEPADLDRYDVCVAVDSATRSEVLSRVDQQFLQYYSDKVLLLSAYAQQHPLPDAEVLRTGGLALLPRQMSQQLGPRLEELRRVVDVPRPCLADAGVDAWNGAVLVTMLGAAGLANFLIKQDQEGLPDYDPL